MEHPKAVGDRSQLAVMLALRDVGFDVYLPFGENTRCDLIVDDGIRLRRVQCKTGRLRLGTVWFNVCSCYGHHRNPRDHRRTYEGQIDDFAVFCPQTAGVYLVPIDDVPVKSTAALRVEPTRNRQRHGIRFAADYQIATIRVSATAEPGARPGAAGSCA
jgi:PD-(D/E)XK nuclease superfamily protein